ncbi:MAG: hypothetical protein CYPHOPRED_005987 [Cyphobasidiales sp. Tagirdzhanova-0007]|nr:MAG: hypothetical protein CYPHOPRED_005987 [Cyphobasidiales sp. Tagirdzhanova-0007]
MSATKQTLPGGSKPLWKTLNNNAANYWWRDRGLRRCMVTIVVLYGAIFAYGYDGSLIGTLQALPLWNKYFNTPSGIHLGLISAAYLFRPMVSGFGKTEASFIAGRVVTGAFFQVTAAPLIAEIAHPRFRSVTQASFYGTYFVGAFTAGWIGYGVIPWANNWSWRIVTIFQGLGCLPILVLGVTPWMPESPRWLIKQGQRERAHTLLADLHANGDKTDQLVLCEMEEISAALNLDVNAEKGAFTDFLKTPGNRRRLGAVVWFGWALSMSGIEGIQAGQFAFLFVVSMIGAQLVDRIGRRRLLLGGCTIAIVMFAIFTALTATFVKSMNHQVALAAVPILFLFAGSFVIWLFPLPFLYLPEILPYNLRTKGMAIYTVVTNAGALFNALVNPVALAAIGWKYYLMFIVLDVCELAIAYFLIIETKGFTLEEIAGLFDGPTAPALEAGFVATGLKANEDMRQEEIVDDDK